MSLSYDWLLAEGSPRMIVEALRLTGTREMAGDGNNPVILEWAKECGIRGYNADAIPWCGLFVAVVAKRAGKPIPKNPLWARNWIEWGATSSPELGAVMVFSRGSGGHVGLYVAEDDDCYHVLGGNQGDSVSIARIDKARRLACRAMYTIGKPRNVRAIRVMDGGNEVSKNEA